MKDYLKQELSVGDKIIVATAHGRNSGASLRKAVIIRFTPKMVVFNGSDYTGMSRDEGKCYPDKCVKYSDMG